MPRTRQKPYAAAYDRAYEAAHDAESAARKGRCQTAISEYGEMMMAAGQYWTSGKKDPEYAEREEHLSDLETDTISTVADLCLSKDRMAGIGRSRKSRASRKTRRRSRR